ncbi:MAG: ROK family protein [Nitrospirota bacterium]
MTGPAQSSRIAIGVDLGGTAIKALAVTDAGRILARTSRPTEVSAGPAQVVKNLAATIHDLQSRLRAEPSLHEGPDAVTLLPTVGVGVPGVLDVERGLVIASPNFPDWECFPLRDRLQEACGQPVLIENDANAAALGEQWLGSARDARSFLFITIGTGIGGGLVLDGALWRGPGGRAGEFGHIKVVPDGEPCGCGSRGCLERYANAAALERFALDALERGSGGPLRALAMDRPEALDPDLIAQAARAGDAAARWAYRQCTVYLSMGVADVVNLLDLRCYIIGGGISEAFDLFAPWLREEVAKRIYGVAIEEIAIRQAACGNDAGSLGMASLVLVKPC